MILLSAIVQRFESELLTQYRDSLLPSHFKALAAMKDCRTSASPAMLLQCTACDHRINDKQLQGTPGAIAVLHTHSRRLDFHPHVHLVMPAAAIDTMKRLWRTKKAKGEGLSRQAAGGHRRRKGSRCHNAIPKSGSWTANASAPATRRWSISGAISTVA